MEISNKPTRWSIPLVLCSTENSRSHKIATSQCQSARSISVNWKLYTTSVSLSPLVEYPLECSPNLLRPLERQLHGLVNTAYHPPVALFRPAVYPLVLMEIGVHHPWRWVPTQRQRLSRCCSARSTFYIRKIGSKIRVYGVWLCLFIFGFVDIVVPTALLPIIFTRWCRCH